MTFIELLSLLAFTTPFICSLESGWKADKGFGIVIGLIVGLALSFCSFAGMRILSRWIRRHPKFATPHPGIFWIGLSWLLCAAVFLWIFGLSFFGIWLTKLIIHNSAA
jgi:hypothetical protein